MSRLSSSCGQAQEIATTHNTSRAGAGQDHATGTCTNPGKPGKHQK